MAKEITPVAQIAQSLYLLRGVKVMLDVDLAALYEVTTGALNQAVRRNRSRFPEDFMFQLSPGEEGDLKCQFGISNESAALKSQIVISKKGRGGRRHRSYAFTEQGVAMLSSVLRSERAVQVNIAIMRAFVNSGERTRLACWRWRPRRRELSPGSASPNRSRSFSARRRKEHARRVRSPAHRRR